MNHGISPTPFWQMVLCQEQLTLLPGGARNIHAPAVLRLHRSRRVPVCKYWDLGGPAMVEPPDCCLPYATVLIIALVGISSRGTRVGHRETTGLGGGGAVTPVTPTGPMVQRWVISRRILSASSRVLTLAATRMRTSLGSSTVGSLESGPWMELMPI